ncbi:MAG: Flp pilus assembly protein CpaB [Gemmatimonadota bacterium]|nr:Flp pilus assembly protein CpaB [Gemmatimonadota bacterium]
MNRRSRPWLLLLLALASGGLAAYLALRYLRQQATPLLAAESSKRQVVLAVRDLPVGALLSENDVRTVDWPGDALPPGYMSSVAEVANRGVITPVRLNEPILDSKLAPKGAGGGLPMIIGDGMRALSVRVDEVIGVAGFVIPGTRVDVLLTMDDPQTTNEPTTRAILQNIPALAAGQSIQTDQEGKPKSVPVITVLVTPEQAETLALASQQGRIQMALRNTLDTTRITTTGARKSTLFSGRRVPPRPRRSAGASPATVAPPPSNTIIEGFRGGERTLTKFSRP